MSYIFYSYILKHKTQLFTKNYSSICTVETLIIKRTKLYQLFLAVLAGKLQDNLTHQQSSLLYSTEE